MSAIFPIFEISRRNKSARRWLKKLMLVLLLVLPVSAAVAAKNYQAPKGYGAVPVEWCGFYPQLPSCPGSGIAVTTKGAPPKGMLLVPVAWCTFIPTLPICNGGPVMGGKPEEVTAFGTNPGNLRMFRHVPKNLEASRPLVVALHGCVQQAENYDEETGWVQLADKFRFAVLFPQETVNGVKCFRWFDPNHNVRDQGEALSIRNMIEKMKTDLDIDPKRIFVTGLSAGGAMTAVMLATYPDVFAGGGIIAGIPYKCANSEAESKACGVLKPNKLSPAKQSITPVQWGNLVRQASNHTGTFPRVSIWQGGGDSVVDPQNQNELMEQWTNVQNIDQTPDITNKVKGHAHQVFQDDKGNALVETFRIEGMEHGTPIDPGSAVDQCGTTAHDNKYIISAGICSSYFISTFWGIDK